jgi:hypothetical protein
MTTVEGRNKAIPGEPGSEAELAELASILDGCMEAVEEEIDAVRQDLARRGLDDTVPAADGHLMRTSAPGFLYEFQLPRDPYDIRPEDGVWVRVEGAEALGFVTGFDRRSGLVRIALPDWLGRRPSHAELEFDPTWLLTALVMRLAEIKSAPDRFFPLTMLRLFGRSWPELHVATPNREPSAELNTGQRRALERVLGSDVHFVWGPPGTGKTVLVGHAVAELAEAGRVLVVATTNAAIDEAATRAARVLGRQAVGANRIIRVGAEFSRTGDPMLSLSAALQRRVDGGSGRVATVLEEVERRLGVNEPSVFRTQSARSAAWTAEHQPESVWARHGRLLSAARARDDEEATRTLERLAGELSKQAILALRGADVVLTTLARLASRDELAALRFDSLVIDEASTAPLPYLAMAACRASTRTVAVGDFQQLPAIVVSRGEAGQRWLSRDVFHEAGVVQEAAPGELPIPSERDGLCAMLVEQYRMAPPVRRLVSDFFYGGRLEDAPELHDRPTAPHPLALVDTSGLKPTVERSEGSRANAAHAEAVLALLGVATLRGVDDVAVVVPYRLQARRLWQLVRGRLGAAAPRQLEISTVHRFQGREKSVVIFDTVDGPPGRSWFLHEGHNPDFPRLLNVALSRTRDMLVLVGSVEGLRTTLPVDALLNRVVERMRTEGCVVDARAVSRDAGALFRARS